MDLENILLVIFLFAAMVFVGSCDRDVQQGQVVYSVQYTNAKGASEGQWIEESTFKTKQEAEEKFSFYFDTFAFRKSAEVGCVVMWRYNPEKNFWDQIKTKGKACRKMF